MKCDRLRDAELDDIRCERYAITPNEYCPFGQQVAGNLDTALIVSYRTSPSSPLWIKVLRNEDQLTYFID